MRGAVSRVLIVGAGIASLAAARAPRSRRDPGVRDVRAPTDGRRRRLGRVAGRSPRAARDHPTQGAAHDRRSRVGRRHPPRRGARRSSALDRVPRSHDPPRAAVPLPTQPTQLGLDTGSAPKSRRSSTATGRARRPSAVGVECRLHARKGATRVSETQDVVTAVKRRAHTPGACTGRPATAAASSSRWS